MLKKWKAIQCLVLPGIAMLPVAAHATGINPDANLTLPSTTIAGPAIYIDDIRGNGGFDGFLPNIEGSVVLFTLRLGGTRN